MKIVCHRESMLSAYQTASQVACTRDVKPILKCIKAVVANGRCTLLATDLELGIRIDVPAVTINEDGEAMLPPHVLSILREAKSEYLTIEANAIKCQVVSDDGRFDMPGEDPSTFPDVPEFNADGYCEVAAEVLRDMVQKTTYAAKQETSSRFATAGILVEFIDGQLILVGTDGRRLATTSAIATSVNHPDIKGQRIIPVKVFTILSKLMSDDGAIKINLGQDDNVLIKTDTATIYSRLIEGRFPQYRQAIPQKLWFTVELPVSKLLTLTRQAAIMTSAESKRVSLRFAPGKLSVHATDTHGTSEIEMPIECSKSLEISLAAKDLAEMLRSLDPDSTITFKAQDKKTPAVATQGDLTCVLVPLCKEGEK